MSIRSNSLPQGNNISLQLQDVLRRNGIQAEVSTDGVNYTMTVQGHDSPQLTYSLSRNQYNALVDGGTNSSYKRAYKTFVDLVHNDFDCPKDFVHARNANSKVTMGLHGYRVQDRGVTPMPIVHGHGMPHERMSQGMHGHFMPHGRGDLGWTPRQQDGFHMRRVGGELIMQGGPMIPERENGYMKPGELQSGAYGFYYKGNNKPVVTQDPLLQLQTVVKPVELKKEPADKYRDLISSAVYFTNEKWQQCLKSHGIEIDAENRKLRMTNFNYPEGLSYELTEQQVKELTNNKLKGDSVYHRIDIINGVIGKDFQNKLTFDMLNSKEQPDLKLTAEKEASINKIQQQNQTVVAIADPLQNQHSDRIQTDNSMGVNGQDLDDSKGWYRQTVHGREVNVGNIWVEQKQNTPDDSKQKEPDKVKYQMSAVINGQVVSHEITQKQYDKFLALDDYHRMKMFDKVFDEVKMKTVPGQGMSFGQALLGGLAFVGQAVGMAGDITHDVDHIRRPYSAPDVYSEEHHHHGRVYVKAGLDTPDTVASRIFEAGMNAGFRDAALHR